MDIISLKEIYFNLISKEKYKSIKDDYMKQRNEINFKMREILVNWLINVCMIYSFKNHTLFYCIKIIDLYLSNKYY